MPNLVAGMGRRVVYLGSAEFILKIELWSKKKTIINRGGDNFQGKFFFIPCNSSACFNTSLPNISTCCCSSYFILMAIEHQAGAQVREFSFTDLTLLGVTIVFFVSPFLRPSPRAREGD